MPATFRGKYFLTPDKHSKAAGCWRAPAALPSRPNDCLARLSSGLSSRNAAARARNSSPNERGRPGRPFNHCTRPSSRLDANQSSVPGGTSVKAPSSKGAFRTSASTRYWNVCNYVLNFIGSSPFVAHFNRASIANGTGRERRISRDRICRCRAGGGLFVISAEGVSALPAMF